MKNQLEYPANYLKVLQQQDKLELFPSSNRIIAGGTLPKFLPNVPAIETYRTLTSLADADYYFGMAGKDTRCISINPDTSPFRLSVAANSKRGTVLERDAIIISRKTHFEALIAVPGNCPFVLLTNEDSDYLAVVRCGRNELENNILRRTAALLESHFQADPKEMLAEAYGSINAHAEVRSIVYAMPSAIGLLMSHSTINYYLNDCPSALFYRFE